MTRPPEVAEQGGVSPILRFYVQEVIVVPGGQPGKCPPEVPYSSVSLPKCRHTGGRERPAAPAAVESKPRLGQRLSAPPRLVRRGWRRLE